MIGKARETPYYFSDSEMYQIEKALEMYIDYLKDGGDDDKDDLRKAVRTYNKIKEGETEQ